MPFSDLAKRTDATLTWFNYKLTKEQKSAKRNLDAEVHKCSDILGPDYDLLASARKVISRDETEIKPALTDSVDPIS